MNKDKFTEKNTFLSAIVTLKDSLQNLYKYNKISDLLPILSQFKNLV